MDLLSPRRTARPPGKAPGGTEGGQAARRQEPRRGELERRLRVERVESLRGRAGEEGMRRGRVAVGGGVRRAGELRETAEAEEAKIGDLGA